MKIYTLCVDLVDNEKILSSSKREVVEEVEKLILNDIKNLKELLCEKYREQFFNDESNIEQFEHTSYKNMEEFLRNSEHDITIDF